MYITKVQLLELQSITCWTYIYKTTTRFIQTEDSFWATIFSFVTQPSYV